jgi:hypothetical protein
VIDLDRELARPPKVVSVEAFARAEGLDLVSFSKGQRKDKVTQQYVARSRQMKVFCTSAGPRRKHVWYAPSGAVVPAPGSTAAGGGQHCDGEPLLLLLRG